MTRRRAWRLRHVGRWATTLTIMGLATSACSGPQPSQGRVAAKVENTISDDLQIERTPARLERGRYLVTAVVQCLDCHSENDDSERPRRLLKPGGGRVMGKDVRGQLVVAPNITPDNETGAGSWTDAQFARAIRQGIGHDGRILHPRMPYRYFNSISDEDLAAVIVYIRSAIPAIRNALPKTEMNAWPSSLMPRPAQRSVSSPDPKNHLAYGAYLANLAHCSRCHTPLNGDDDEPIQRLLWSGGQLFGPPGHMIASANITQDATGIPYYDVSVFITTIRAGAVNNVRPLSNIMPWAFFRNMTDSDLRDVFTYLQSAARPVVHSVDNREPPTLCPIDGNLHGFGNRNHQPAANATGH